MAEITRAETVLTEDGVSLWAVRTGEGCPVVFCHGGPGLWDTLEDVAGPLSGVAAVHRWDQRGCGRSQRTGPYSMARTMADLDAVRRHFGLSDMVLLGHSWGAQLALRYTLDHPEHVRGLIYVAGTGIDPGAPWRDEYGRNLRARLGGDLERWSELNDKERTDAEDRELSVLQWTADFADHGQDHEDRGQDRDQDHGQDHSWAREQAERMATPWLGVNFACNAAINAEGRRTWGAPELHARCAASDVPVLIVDGAEDIRPRWAVDSLERALPRVSRVVLEGAGHLPWTEDPDGFQAAVRAFLTA
ncbi:alpha/beta fold hydrolase [Nonomuraea zeae]|uniref:Alpha/beta hydrolase n=1 Tax=Nonomuraea zeae TaxID=1642303 RepID=A0A5S4G9Y0_9ACTN|nr:alpha/beta hydrolase [Nonomuraea zeae]TMR29251.1 alpha/beta hydrolase [Nonomuraea zeae]